MSANKQHKNQALEVDKPEHHYFGIDDIFIGVVRHFANGVHPAESQRAIEQAPCFSVLQFPVE